VEAQWGCFNYLALRLLFSLFWKYWLK
jgi:hypothetical protein